MTRDAPGLSMDTGGWAPWGTVIRRLHQLLADGYNTNGFRRTSTSAVRFVITENVVLATILALDVKGRFQVAFCKDPYNEIEIRAIRAVQGHSLKFVDEARLAYCPNGAAMLKQTIKELWHGTKQDGMMSILANGLIPGGSDGRIKRNCVHISPVHPWMEGAEYTNRANSDCFVRIDVDKLYQHIPVQHIFQSANGTVLVRNSVPVECFVEIVYQNGPGEYQVVWSASRVGQAPSVVVPSVGGMRDHSGGAVQAVRRWASGSQTSAGSAAGGVGVRLPHLNRLPLGSRWTGISTLQVVSLSIALCARACVSPGHVSASRVARGSTMRMRPTSSGRRWLAWKCRRPARRRSRSSRRPRRSWGLVAGDPLEVRCGAMCGAARGCGRMAWTWLARPDAVERMKKVASKGGVPFSWSTGRCEPWTPTSEHSRPNSQVKLTPRDYVYAVLGCMGGPHTNEPEALTGDAAVKHTNAVTFVNIVSVLGVDVLWEIMRDDAISPDGVFLGIYNTIRDIPQIEESVVQILGNSVDRDDFSFALNFVRREVAQWGAIVDPQMGGPARDAPVETSESKAAALAKAHSITSAIGKARRATPPPKPVGPTAAKASRASGSKASASPPAPKERPSGPPGPSAGSKGKGKGGGGETSATPAPPPPRATQQEKGAGRGSQSSAAPAMPISQSTHKGKSTGRGGKSSAEPAPIPPWRAQSGKSSGRGSQTPVRPETSSASAGAGGKATERGGKSSAPPAAQPPPPVGKSGGKGSGSTPPPPPRSSGRGGQPQRVWVPRGSAAAPASGAMPPPPPRTTIPTSSTSAGPPSSTGTPAQAKSSTPPTLRGSVARDPLITQDAPSQSRLPEHRGSQTSAGPRQDEETGRARESRAQEHRSSPRSRSGTGATGREARPPSAPTTSSRGEERRQESSGHSRPGEHRSRSQHGESSSSRQPSRRSPYSRDTGSRRSSRDDEPRRGRRRSPTPRESERRRRRSPSPRESGGSRRRRDEDPRERGSQTSAPSTGDRPGTERGVLAGPVARRVRDSPTRGPGRGASAPSVAKARRRLRLRSARRASSRQSHDSPYPRESSYAPRGRFPGR